MKLVAGLAAVGGRPYPDEVSEEAPQLTAHTLTSESRTLNSAIDQEKCDRRERA